MAGSGLRLNGRRVGAGRLSGCACGVGNLQNGVRCRKERGTAAPPHHGRKVGHTSRAAPATEIKPSSGSPCVYMHGTLEGRLDPSPEGGGTGAGGAP